MGEIILMKIDLHVHSTASDGKFTPEELVDLAVKNNLKAFAITDHDNIDGLKSAVEYAKNRNMEFIPGIEFSANPGDLAKEIHIVGLFIDHNHKKIKELILKQREFGITHNKKIIKKLNDLGYEITYEEALKESGKESFGRPTIAQILLKKYSQFKDRKQVFNELLGKEGKAFFKSESSSIEEIINTIQDSKGIAILAHPAYLFENAETVIKDFLKFGGEGLEVDCPYESFGEEAQSLREKFRKIAKENNLVISGGTDFHGDKEGSIIGSFGLSEDEFKKLKSYAKK